MFYSFIIPVYNRPDEIDELLSSFLIQNPNIQHEIIIVEDGSTIKSEDVINKYVDKLNIRYFYKPNSGPGDSRNYGMKKALGNYFIILDSDCLLPEHYLTAVDKYLSEHYVDCFGGADAAHKSFSDVQKSINIVMTSFLTTGGIRGKSEVLGKFQPRSFNMGVSKVAFEKSQGFGNIHPGEDPDLSIRLWEMGFQTALIPQAFVYHKRRIDWGKFKQQVTKFGKVRPILNLRYPAYRKITYWLPTLYLLGLFVAFICVLFNFIVPICLVALFWLAIAIEGLVKEKNIKVALYCVFALNIQFLGYGMGFLHSFIQLNVLRRKPKNAMPYLFFKNNK